MQKRKKKFHYQSWHKHAQYHLTYNFKQVRVPVISWRLEIIDNALKYKTNCDIVLEILGKHEEKKRK